MHDPLLARRYDATLGGAASPRPLLAWSALPDAPVVRDVEAAPSGWRRAVAGALRRAAARLDRPVARSAPAC